MCVCVVCVSRVMWKEALGDARGMQRLLSCYINNNRLIRVFVIFQSGSLQRQDQTVCNKIHF